MAPHNCKPTVYTTAARKTAQSIRITWVKGHATKEHIDKGITTQANKAGNDKADEIADIGTKLFGEDVMQIAENLHFKHKYYQNFMFKVTKHIIEAYHIHRQLCDIYDEEIAAKNKIKDEGIQYQELTYAKPQHSHKLELTSDIRYYNKYIKTNQSIADIQHFLYNLKVVSTADCRPITWIELYILYRIRGYKKPIADPEHKAISRATAAKQINAFKKYFRGVTSRCMMDSAHSSYFTPARARADSLKGVAINGKHAALNFNAETSNSENRAIAHNLIKLCRTVPLKKLNAFLDRKSSLIPANLKSKGKAAWDSSIYKSTTYTPRDKAPETCPASTGGTQNTHYYICPSCKGLEPSTCKAFQHINLDQTHKCIMCKRTTKVNTWKCECNTRWHICDTHKWTSLRLHSMYSRSIATIPNSAKDNPLANNTAKRKRPLCYQDLDSLKAEDISRAAKHAKNAVHAEINLGWYKHGSIKQSMLSPMLKRKFANITISEGSTVTTQVRDGRRAR